jgi:hypothetical protein
MRAAAGSSMPSYAQKPNKWKYWVCGCSVGPSSHNTSHVYTSITKAYTTTTTLVVTAYIILRFFKTTENIMSDDRRILTQMKFLSWYGAPQILAELQHASQITRTENTRSLEHQISNFAST